MKSKRVEFNALKRWMIALVFTAGASMSFSLAGNTQTTGREEDSGDHLKNDPGAKSSAGGGYRDAF